MAENTETMQANTSEETVVATIPVDGISFDRYAIFETGGSNIKQSKAKLLL